MPRKPKYQGPSKAASVTDAQMNEVFAQERQTFADKHGIKTSQVVTAKLELQKMLALGTLVDLYIGGMSMGSTRANLKELGIPETAARALRIKPGKLEILPAKYFSPIASIGERQRMALENNSTHVPLFRGWRLVSYAQYETWQQERERLDEELAAAKKRLLDNYDQIRQDLINDFSAIAEEAHKALVAAAGEWAEPLSSFRQFVVDRALSKLPSRQRIEDEIVIRYTTLQLIDEITYEERLLALQEKVNNANARHNDNVALAQQLEREALKLKAMHEAEVRHLQQQLEETTNPINDVLDAVRNEIVTQVREALEIVRAAGHLPGRTAKKLEGLRALAQVKSACSVQPDTELDDLLGELQDKLKLAPGKRDDGRSFKYDAEAVAETMREIVNLTLGDDVPRVNPRRVQAWSALELDNE